MSRPGRSVCDESWEGQNAMEQVVARLLASDEPSVRYKVRVGVFGENPDSRAMRALRREIADSPRVRALLSQRSADGKIPGGPYRKWTGSHWVLTMLADLGYPEDDSSLRPMIEQGVSWAMRQTARVVEGRARRCASQEGNALLYMLRRGFADARCGALAERLMQCQWPDGGWNCDKRPEATHSSFHESLIPLRALNAYAQTTGRTDVRDAVRRAAEMFLDRSLYLRKTTGEVMRPRFAMIHYPYFWQYTFLHGLRVMAACGLIHDPRCAPALDLLESKRTPDGGFPAERRYYSVAREDAKRCRSGQTLVGWGPTSEKRTRLNEFATAEALCVLKAAGRA